jgi:hypothetical protein
MARVAITLWSGKGPRACWESKTVRTFLDLALAPIIRIHTTPAGLIANGDRLTQEIRRKLPGTEIWWAITGDTDGPDPSIPWADAGRACQAAGVDLLELNCEKRWKTRPKGTATRAIAALRTAAPRLEIGHTAYPSPVSIVIGKLPSGKPKRWGGHSDYPWKEFLGPSSPITRSAKQIYWATSTTKVAAVRGIGPRTQGYSERSWAEAVRKGWIRADVVVDCYLTTYGCRTDDLCTVGTSFDHVSWWVANAGLLKSHGQKAIRALCELHRRGFDGPDAIQRFQSAAQIKVDGIVGPQTLGALEIR